LKVGTFDPLENIQTIFLSGNQISVLENEIFVKNSYLSEVNLNQNQIFAIGKNAFSWKKLGRLHLLNNACVNFEFYFSAFVDRIYIFRLRSNCFDIYESHKKILREITESLNLKAMENELAKKVQCSKTTAEISSNEIYQTALNDSYQNLTSCLNEIPKSIKSNESNSTEKLKRTLAGQIIDLFGPEATLLIFIGIIVLQTIIITLFVIIKFYRKRSNNSNNQPPIPGTVNLNLAEYDQPRDFFRVSTDSHFYAEVGTELKKGEPVYAEVDKSKR
jgi:hypothetical protein